MSDHQTVPDTERSPAKPWIQGVHPGYSAFRLVVTICQDASGRVWSEHEFDTVADEQVARGIPGGAVRQTAHALLTEAVRREAFACVLLELSERPEFLKKRQAADETVRSVMDCELQRAVETVMSRTIPKMTPGAVREVLEMVARQMTSGHGG